LRPLAQMLVTTHAAHCGRRRDEMAGVARMLEEAEITDQMCQATRNFLETSFRSGVTKHFNHKVPDRVDDVIAYFLEHRGLKKQ
jgi:hypothetical protein